MKILIDIGHPAHVHYFKNFIKIMERRGHEFLIVARDREVIHKLLRAENIGFKNRGKGAKSIIGKIFYMLKADLLLFYYHLKFRPDIYLSHGSHYTMHIAKIMGKPCVSTGDSDHIKLNAKLLMPYLDALLTPSVYRLEYGNKHIKFNGYMELLYLHPNYFKLKTEKVREALGLEMEEEFYILRFISWDSFHDTNQRGFTKSQKLALIEFLSKQGRVFISSECQLSKSLEQYKLNIPPELLHDVLAEATLCISEGATTASEASVLGTATIYVNSLDVSYCKEQDEVYNINHCFKNGDGVIEKVSEILNQENLKETYKKRQKNLIKDKINPSSFLVWFIENYPESLETMKKHPEYQDRFKA